MSDEDGHGGLNAEQHDLVQGVLAGGSVSVSAEKAGYSPESKWPWQIMRLPAAKEALRDGVAGQILLHAPRCVGYLRGVVDGTEKPDRYRIDAAKTLLDRGGFGARGAPEAQEKSQVTLAEMDNGQLAEFIRNAQRTISDRAVTVLDAGGNAPDSAPNEAEVADLLG